jgi:hypothetical protein
VRPPVLENHEADLKAYKKTKSIVSFPLSEEIPSALAKVLVLASIEEMKRNQG